MHEALVSESKVLAFCPNCGGDCEPLFQCDHRRAQSWICDSCGYLCRLHYGRHTLDPMTVGELRVLMTLPGWHYIADTQACIRLRAVSIPCPRRVQLYRSESDPEAPGDGWRDAGGEVGFVLSFAAAAWVVLFAVKAWG